MEDSPEKEMQFPRIYTVHSQKGGVGKTSIGLAIAGFAAIFKRKKTLIIDADLTGASLVDLFKPSAGKPIRYFNEVILAKPDKFAKYAPIAGLPSKRGSDSTIKEFCLQVPGYDDICFIPSSPCLGDISQIVPLISQEDHLHFFRFRMEDIIVAALAEGFEAIIIDHSPGLFGISISSLGIVLDQIANHSNNGENVVSRTRLDKLFAATSGVSFPRFVASQSFLVMTPDPCDYRALLPSLSWFLTKRKESLPLGDSREGLDVVLNKAKAAANARFDPVILLDKIFEDVRNFPDVRKVEDWLISALRERARKRGALACGDVPNFDLQEILPSIENLKNRKERVLGGIRGWCEQIGKSAYLYRDDTEVSLSLA